MNRRYQFLTAGDQCLMDPLTGPQADLTDLDVLLGPQALDSDHLARQVQNAHPLAHVQDEDLPALGVAGGLDYQTRGPRPRHEEASRVGVGDGDRPALPDLTRECPHPTPTAPEPRVKAQGA